VHWIFPSRRLVNLCNMMKCARTPDLLSDRFCRSLRQDAPSIERELEYSLCIRHTAREAGQTLRSTVLSCQ